LTFRAALWLPDIVRAAHRFLPTASRGPEIVPAVVTRIFAMAAATRMLIVWAPGAATNARLPERGALYIEVIADARVVGAAARGAKIGVALRLAEKTSAGNHQLCQIRARRGAALALVLRP
jgi:hypothetical protein